MINIKQQTDFCQVCRNLVNLLSPSMSTTTTILPSDTVTSIVLQHYRTADVFTKYEIEFCCGGRRPIEAVCASKELDINQVLAELNMASGMMQLSGSDRFNEWNVAFLSDFIVHVYHFYLRETFPLATLYVSRFLDGHLKKFPVLAELPVILSGLHSAVTNHLRNEEESFFPYTKQVFNAYLHREPYAGLLVKTMKKPWEEELAASHRLVKKKLDQLRCLTNHYELHANACATHRVSFLKLKELDHELTQYLQLEENFLLPKVSALEIASLNNVSS